MDNAINHADVLQPAIDKAMADTGLDSVLIAAGKGLLVCRKI
jgi:hypothetical protein